VIWVLDDPRAGTAAQAIGIAERLGMPFRRIPLTWNWKVHVAGLVPHGSLMGVSGPLGLEERSAEAPKLVISAGRRSAPVALWLKSHFGCKLVHCMSPGISGVLHREDFDLLVIPAHDKPAAAPNVMPVLGATNRISPLVLTQAEIAWHERLAHLPHPRLALIVGGKIRSVGMPPALAQSLGREVALMALGMGGSVMATTSRRTGDAASDALADGLGPVLHVLYRWGEPGENPYLGYLATADAIVVTADSVSMISEACATDASVFVALPEMAGPKHKMMIETLVQAGQVRPLSQTLSTWERQPLDESGRVADEIRRRFKLG
jgi:mitochondrial fission protein ELM1